jgi:endonuclease YncB( thermonuclease family)
MRKSLIFILTLLFSFLLIGCNGSVEVETVNLPNLNNLNKSQVLTKMDELGLDTVILDEVNNKAQEGLFSSFGDDFKVGDEVEKGSEIKVYFAIHKNTLPDLTGLTKEEAVTEFSYVRFNYTIVEVESDEVGLGKFLRYDHYETGTELPEDTVVTVYFALKPFPEKHKLIISKYVEGRQNNKGFEIYNSLDQELDLSLFTIGIYHNGSENPTKVITFSQETIKAKGVIVIVDENSTQEFKEKATQIESLNIDGNDAIAILYRGEVLDVVGHIGMGMVHINNMTLIREENITENKNTFSLYDWDEYGKNRYDLFGAHPVIYPKTFTISEEWLTKDYFTEDGGVVKVTYEGTADGDTSYFAPHFLTNSRIRYVGVDTPETADPDPNLRNMAAQATQFTAGKLSNATEIYIQHDPNSGRQDTYERNLGLVWYDGKLLNYELVLNGYSRNMYDPLDETFVYEGIPLNIWFKNAEKHAQENKLGIWSFQTP